MKDIVDLKDVSKSDVKIVGGKNASLGEMIQNLSGQGVRVPAGFATTIAGYEKFIAQNQLKHKIDAILNTINFNQIDSLHKSSAKIRKLITAASFSSEFEKEITNAYQKLRKPAVAVRSSAITEDSANASFAGMQETYLNISGLQNILRAIKLVFASLFTSRAIQYRHEHQVAHDDAISVGIMPMIRSDKAISGVVFTLDTESGFDNAIVISASYGLGEGIVQGHVNPDQYITYKPNIAANRFAILQRKLGDKSKMMIYTKSNKPREATKMTSVPKNKRDIFCMTDKEVELLAKQALIIENHYGMPMDIEWAKDGLDGNIYLTSKT